MASSQGLLTSDSVTYKNLQNVAYKKTDYPLEGRVVSMTAVDNYVIIGITHSGCHIYSVQKDKLVQTSVLAEQPKGGGKKIISRGSTCRSINACTKHILYIKETEGDCCICVHRFKDIIAGKLEPLHTLALQKWAPLAYDPGLGLIAIGGSAWTSSWVGTEAGEDEDQGSGEKYLHVLNIEDLSRVQHWKAVDNSVFILRIQSSETKNILGVADTRNGLKVYDLNQPNENAYYCLYCVPVEEVRNFQIVGDSVGVFHKFEPSVSFWNMKEKKTILCINIQEQMKELAEEYYEDEDDENSLFDEEDDNVTAVSSLPFENDHLLIYGTRAGCIFGMAVNLRTQLFSIPLAQETCEDDQVRKSVLGVTLLPDGKLIACYEGYGVTVLDFSPENPPDRPPTRGQAK